MTTEPPVPRACNYIAEWERTVGYIITPDNRVLLEQAFDAYAETRLSAEKTPDSVVEEARTLLRTRAAHGLKKYGVTLDRTDLHFDEWVTHALEEASDLLVYLLRIRRSIRMQEHLMPSFTLKEKLKKAINQILSSPETPDQ